MPAVMHPSPSSLIFFSRPPARLLLTSPIACIPTFTQRRGFLNPSSFDGLFATSTPVRQLTHSRVLPYPRSAVFDAIVSVEKYPSFLPFVQSAHVSERDQHQLPSRASLKVGYDALGIAENWESLVTAAEAHGTIEARSADVGNENGLFEVLKTKWQLHEIEDTRRQGLGIGAQTAVRLDVQVKFRSAMYDKVFAGVEEKVAGMMVGAFEKRIKELASS